ncbi:MAG: redoxin domain-containing protein [Spirochaetes bacterium]|jgi:peroxiredoxin|nr:redoxin domain-containing protein [Spirochaetota bacterium]
MAETPSTMVELGTQLPEFLLPDYDGAMHSSADYAGRPLLVVFICNHCPFVKHIIPEFSRQARDYQDKGVAVVAISSNDTEAHPQDDPAHMKRFAAENDFSFPYLFDETQDVARRYQAACTPDFFLFDPGHRLVYRGQFDSSRPSNDVPVTGKDLANAVDRVARGEQVPSDQTPSVGCNIKWKPGKEPGFFGLS